MPPPPAVANFVLIPGDPCANGICATGVPVVFAASIKTGDVTAASASVANLDASD